MAIVYRIQHKTSRTGPYIYKSNCFNDNQIALLEKMHGQHRDVTHPPPIDDKGIERHAENKEYCGFATLRDLKKWFRGWLVHLKKMNFEVRKITNAKITAKGRYQILFTYKPF